MFSGDLNVFHLLKFMYVGSAILRILAGTLLTLDCGRSKRQHSYSFQLSILSLLYLSAYIMRQRQPLQNAVLLQRLQSADVLRLQWCSDEVAVSLLAYVHDDIQIYGFCRRDVDVLFDRMWASVDEVSLSMRDRILSVTGHLLPLWSTQLLACVEIINKQLWNQNITLITGVIR